MPRGANLGRKVGKRGDVVAGQGRGVGQLRAGQLHAVARVAAESHGCGVELDDGLRSCGRGHDPWWVPFEASRAASVGSPPGDGASRKLRLIMNYRQNRTGSLRDLMRRSVLEVTSLQERSRVLAGTRRRATASSDDQPSDAGATGPCMPRKLPLVVLRHCCMQDSARRLARIREEGGQIDARDAGPPCTVRPTDARTSLSSRFTARLCVSIKVGSKSRH